MSLTVDNLDKNRFLEEATVPFIHNLIEEVEDGMMSTLILQAFGILDPRNLSQELQLSDRVWMSKCEEKFL